MLGDFAWVEQHANQYASLRALVRFLRERYPRVSALDVVTDGLQARAAEAHQLIIGGEDAHSHRRIVVTQEHFYTLLTRDIDAARERVVIYSPFLTPDRVGALEPHLRVAVERGLCVYLITKTLEERNVGQRETSREIESILGRWGVAIVHKFHMHEKLVFIDEDIIWSGSLNSLSFADTQEVMERRVSREVGNDYARVLRLDALLAAHEAREDRCCPVCGGGACRGRVAQRRSLLLPCARCGNPVEFRQMPSGPHWRCTANNRHRQRVIASHLRLLRMRELIPRADLNRLKRELTRAVPGE